MTNLLRAILAIWLLRIVVFRTSAYIDPGSGSMLLQVLLGGVAGVAVLARLFWYQDRQRTRNRSRTFREFPRRRQELTSGLVS